MPFMGIAGLILIGGTLVLTAIYIIRQGLNGISEIFFINGISFWTVLSPFYGVIRVELLSHAPDKFSGILYYSGCCYIGNGQNT